jgi:branched-chain amino acid transport system permease protein
MNFLTSSYFIYSLTFILIYSALAVILHIQVSMTGIVNFGIVGFWGLGMYTFSLFLVSLNLPFIVAMLLAAIVTGLVSLLIGRIILDLDEQAVLVGTLAFATIIEDLTTTEKWLTNGVMGFGFVELPFKIGGSSYYTNLVWMVVVLAVLILLLLYSAKMKKAPYGRLLQSIKDNEPLARSLGKSTFRNKIVLFVFTSVLIGLLGAMAAPVYNFIFPRMISASVTFTVWIALMLGGRKKLLGGPVGILITLGIFDILVESVIPIPQQFAEVIPNIKLTVYGLTLMLVLMFRPLGVLGGKNKEVRG